MKPTYLKAAPCSCPEPVGDPREGCCILCGHQVKGYTFPDGPRSISLAGNDRSTFARKGRKFRPAA